MKHADILSEIRSHCRNTGISESTFGLRAVNDGKLVERLSAGRTITLDTADRIRAYMASNPPQQ